jgi:hypothetical protein
MLFLFSMVDLMLSSDLYDVRLKMIAQSRQAANGHGRKRRAKAAIYTCII